MSSGSPNPYQALAPYQTRYLARHLLALSHDRSRLVELEELLLDLAYVEAMVGAGFVSELVECYVIALERLPTDRPQRAVIKLVLEVLQRDVKFIARHPNSLFQCLWNQGYWSANPEAAGILPTSGTALDHREASSADTPRRRLCCLVEHWRESRERASASAPWIRLMWPSPDPIDTGCLLALTGHAQGAHTAAFSPDGTRILTGGSDATLRHWDAKTGREIGWWRAGKDWRITCAAHSPDGRHIVCSAFDQTARVMDADTGEERVLFQGHDGPIRSVVFLRDGALVASGGDDGAVRIWNALTGKELQCLQGHEQSVFAVDASRAGTLVVSGASDGTLRIWDSKTGRQLLCVEAHKHGVNAARFSADGKRIVSGGSDKRVCVWNALSGEQLLCVQASDSVRCVEFSPGETTIAAGSCDGILHVWHATTGRDLAWRRVHPESVDSIGFSPDGGRIVTCAFRDVRVWDTASLADGPRPQGHDDRVSCLAFSADGQRIASCCAGNRILVWETISRRRVLDVSAHKWGIKKVMFCVGGQRIASLGGDGLIMLWDAATGRQLHSLHGHDRTVRGMALTVDGCRILSVSDDASVVVWDASSGEKIERRRLEAVNCLACSPDGRRFVTGADGGSLREWDSQTCTEIRRFEGHRLHIYSVAYSVDGTTLASQGSDIYLDRERELLVWDATTGKCTERIDGEGDVKAIANGASGYPFRAICHTSETAIEDSATGEPVAWLPTRFSRITTHPSGRMWAGCLGADIYLFRLEEVALRSNTAVRHRGIEAHRRSVVP